MHLKSSRTHVTLPISVWLQKILPDKNQENYLFKYLEFFFIYLCVFIPLTMFRLSTSSLNYKNQFLPSQLSDWNPFDLTLTNSPFLDRKVNGIPIWYNISSLNYASLVYFINYWTKSVPIRKLKEEIGDFCSLRTK